MTRSDSQGPAFKRGKHRSISSKPNFFSIKQRMLNRFIALKRYAENHTLLTAGIAFFGVLLFVYRDIAFGPWKLSFTNFQYSFLPFSSLGIEVKGPLLSDPADNVLPIAYTTYHLLSGPTTWLFTFGIGAAQTMSLYLAPLNWLYALNLDVAQQLISVLKFVLTFSGMYLYIRKIGYTKYGAFISGVSFTFSSAMVMWHGWPHTEVSMIAPFLFYFIESLLTVIRVRYMVGISIAVYLMLAPGMPTYAAYFFYLGVIYGIIFCIRVHWGNCRRILFYLSSCVIPAILGVLASLPYTGELLISVGGNGYVESRANQAFSSLPLSQIKTLFFPYVPTSNSGILHPNEATVFIGVLAVLTLGLTFLHLSKKPRACFFFLASLVLFLLIFTHMLDFIFAHIPLINSSQKYRVIVLLCFALSSLLGINIDDLLTNEIQGGKNRLLALLCTIIPIIIFCSLLVYDWPMLLLADTYSQIETAVSFSISIVFLIVVIFRTFRLNLNTALQGILLCACVSLDMGIFASNYLPLIEKTVPSIPETTDSLDYLIENTKDGSRYVAAGTDSWAYFPSINMFYSIRDARGHGLVFTNEDLSTYYNSIATNSFSSKSTYRWDDIDNENLLKYLGVEFVVYSKESFEQQNIADKHPEWTYKEFTDGTVICNIGPHAQQIELIETTIVTEHSTDVLNMMKSGYIDNALYISSEDLPYSLNSDLETYNSELENNESVSNISYQNGAVSFSVSTNNSRMVLVNEYNDGNWKAYIDGVETAVFKGNYLFSYIQVPEGEHIVELRYEPESLYYFSLIAIGSGAAIVLCILFSRRLNSVIAGLIS